MCVQGFEEEQEQKSIHFRTLMQMKLLLLFSHPAHWIATDMVSQNNHRSWSNSHISINGGEKKIYGRADIKCVRDTVRHLETTHKLTFSLLLINNTPAQF